MWKDILKAPFDAGKRNEAYDEMRRAKRKLGETKPKEDLSTDISTFASKHIDPQTTDSSGYERAFATKGFSKEMYNDAWKPMVELVEKYGIDKLEEELGKLYNTKVFISHRDVGTKLEDYVIDIGYDYEGKAKGSQ